MAWLALALPACAGGKAEPVIGASSGGNDSSRTRVDAGPDDASIPPNFHESLAKMNRARFASRGHAPGRFDVDVYANDLGKETLARASGDVPVGAQFVEEHFERAGTAEGKVGATMMMEKRPKGFDPERGDWRYIVLASTGERVKEGILESCAGCHADAPRDHVFPIIE